ncbi:MAG TPA: hypothetical protein VK549_09620 [Acidimicrobiia bacterium]|nr:hypothetical protein [Acidimicrobiia bacterium]
MPSDDARLEQALHDAAPDVETFGVVAQVTHRRTRRRRNRRIAAGALSAVVLLIVGTLAALATRDDGPSTHVAAPGARLEARVISGSDSVEDGAGTHRAPTVVALDRDAHLLRSPVLVGATAISVASYDPGADGAALSHVVRIEGSHVRDIVDFKARIVSIAEGEGARWALTQNLGATGSKVPDAFLKRISATGDPISTQLPVNADPVGPITAVGGAVWIPVRDGVLQYDANGTFIRKVTLAVASHRWIAQVGKLAYVTDGNHLRSLDVSGSTNDTIDYGPEILGLAAASFDGRVLLAAEGGGLEHARVARALSRGGPVEVTASLPDGFMPDGLSSSTTRVWATGAVDGAPAIALLSERGVVATVVLENASDGAALAWTSAHVVRAVSDGELFEITVP